jgi:hypothetical protein
MARKTFVIDDTAATIIRALLVTPFRIATEQHDDPCLHGLISTSVPFGANLSISSISSSVTAIHPCVQSTSV